MSSLFFFGYLTNLIKTFLYFQRLHFGEKIRHIYQKNYKTKQKLEITKKEFKMLWENRKSSESLIPYCTAGAKLMLQQFVIL